MVQETKRQKKKKTIRRRNRVYKKIKTKTSTLKNSIEWDDPIEKTWLKKWLSKEYKLKLSEKDISDIIRNQSENMIDIEKYIKFRNQKRIEQQINQKIKNLKKGKKLSEAAEEVQGM